MPERPAGSRPQAWHRFYIGAFESLRFDRQYGAMGGESPISFVAIDTFARRHGIAGEAFERLEHFLRAIDGEWLVHVAEEVKKRQPAR